MDTVKKNDTEYKTVMIFGAGASGTTWLLDSLAEVNNLRTIFEPLNPKGVPEANSLFNLYVNENEYHPELNSFFERILNDKLHTCWTDYRFHPHKLIKPKKGSFKTKLRSYRNSYSKSIKQFLTYRKHKNINRIIVKFIRGNLLSGWVAENFDCNIIFILRHPAAVINSRMNKGEEWLRKGEMIDNYFENLSLLNDHLKPFQRHYSNSLSLLEKNVFLWCIENKIPYQQLQNKPNCEILFYENLVLDINGEWGKLKKFHLIRPEKNTLVKPSQQASFDAKKSGINIKNQITKWQYNFNTTQLNQIENILNLFNIPIYSAFDTMPILQKNKQNE